MTMRKLKKTAAGMILLYMLFTLAACSGGGDESSAEAYVSPFDGRDASVLLGYDSMEDYDKEIMMCDTTMAEVDKLMKDGETFVVFFSFEDCPYCNRLIPYLNDAAAEAGVKVGYIDTRSNPEWLSNMDIDDYDKVTDRFGKYLSKDDSGKEHLYTPDTYFIKKGRVVARHSGVTEGADDPEKELSSAQEEQIKKDLKDEFDSLK